VTTSVATAPWAELLVSWDLQQTGYLEHREARFASMLDAIGALVGEDIIVLDVGCGPGSLSQRILDRYEQARCIGIDADPVLLSLGRHAQARFGDRLRWVDADLRSPEWVYAVGAERVDVVVSTTALHWLEPGQLFEFYRQVGGLLRKGGLFLNGDNMPFDPDQAACRSCELSSTPGRAAGATPRPATARAQATAAARCPRTCVRCARPASSRLAPSGRSTTTGSCSRCGEEDRR
jgi:SAM-dependent methyltransferase